MSKIKTPKIEELFDAGVHFGHQVRRWHPRMARYIYTVKKNIHIINLEETERLLKEASEFIYERARLGEQIVFVGTKRQSREIVETEAKRCGAKHVTDRWLGGTITNFKVIKKNIDKLIDMEKKRNAGEYQKYTKKERLLIDREIEKLQKSVGGVVGLRDIPGVLFIIDTKREKTAIHEAKANNIPIVSLIDTNCDPDIVDFPIPGNDDAIKSIAMIVKVIADAVELGYKDYDANKAEIKKREEKLAAADEDDSERKVIRVTSDDENLVIDEDITPTSDLEPIIEKDTTTKDPVLAPESEKVDKKEKQMSKPSATKAVKKVIVKKSVKDSKKGR